MDLSEYVNIPKRVFTEGQLLPVDIFIFMPSNNNVLHFRRKGDPLSPADFHSLMKIPEANLFIRKADSSLMAKSQATQLANEIKNGDINTETVKQGAGALLATLDANKPGGGAEAINGIASVVTEMILDFKQTPSVQAYALVLSRAKQITNPLSAHNYQVSALAVLMLLTVGDGTMDDLVDIGTAGLIHDVGLTDIPAELRERHLVGTEGQFTMTPEERTAYLRHVDVSVEKIKNVSASVLPGPLRIVELHHENFDGSGYRGMSGNQAYRPARVFRIADDIALNLVMPGQTLDMKQLLRKFSEMRSKPAGTPIYDPELLKLLLQRLA